jgi:transglutaminase-like putative cysteine protease
MIFSTIHIIDYKYDKPVSLNPHTIRLKPQTYRTQQLLNFSIEIIPHPIGLTECRDLDGNMEHVAWFNGTTDSLNITVRSKVVTFKADSYASLLTRKATHLPLVTEEVYRPSVKPYLAETIEPDVVAFADQIATEANWDTITFLQLLTKRLYTKCEVTPAEERPPNEPSKTLSECGGICHDLTWLFMACCRSQGIGTRFISGYHGGNSNSTHSLHAWAEAYLPGAGWRGYDPTLGVLVSDLHLALAAGPRADSAAPITGTFCGEATVAMRSSLDLNITAS